jgi:hypothetical protein
MLTATCPEGIYGGDLLIVSTPDGELELEVVVPENLCPGDHFSIQPDPSLLPQTYGKLPSAAEHDIVSRMVRATCRTLAGPCVWSVQLMSHRAHHSGPKGP